jgi:hypothetical protein
MKTSFFFFICLALALAACASPELNSEVSQTQQIEQVKSLEVVEPAETLIPTEKIEETEAVKSLVDKTPTPVEQVDEIPPAETSGPDCYGSEPNQVALGIIDKFEDTTYEQVMLWFCNGAEFENILVALQTEQQTGYPAGDLLLMVAGDQTWEEIWLSIGLIEE